MQNANAKCECEYQYECVSQQQCQYQCQRKIQDSLLTSDGLCILCCPPFLLLFFVFIVFCFLFFCFFVYCFLFFVFCCLLKPTLEFESLWEAAQDMSSTYGWFCDDRNDDQVPQEGYNYNYNYNYNCTDPMWSHSNSNVQHNATATTFRQTV